ncbi:MAG TPA: EamA family transporter [Polyangiaceae bacterium]|nr:EamA family transporter [Polyangiaceae bacterium]
MSSFLVGNVFLVGSMLCNAGSQLLIKKVLDEAQGNQASGSLLQQLLLPERMLRAGLGMSLIAASFVFWILCLARLQLAYAYPISCASVVLMTFFSAVFLNEAVTLRMWAGTACVLLGIVLVGPSR